MLKFLGNDLDSDSKITTFLEGFLMHVTKAQAMFANSQQNYINIHYNTPVLDYNDDFWEDKKNRRV